MLLYEEKTKTRQLMSYFQSLKIPLNYKSTETSRAQVIRQGAARNALDADFLPSQLHFWRTNKDMI